MRQTQYPRRMGSLLSPTLMYRHLTNPSRNKRLSQDRPPSRKYQTRPNAWVDTWPISHLSTSLSTRLAHHQSQDRLPPRLQIFPLFRKMPLVLQAKWTMMRTRAAWSCPRHQAPSETRVETSICQIHLAPTHIALQTLPIPSNLSHRRLVRQCLRRTLLHSTIQLVLAPTSRHPQRLLLGLPLLLPLLLLRRVSPRMEWTIILLL